MSSRGIRNLPILKVPQLPWKPTNVSRLAKPDVALLPVSPLMFDSIWKMALRPPPRDSVPRTPSRDEFELSRETCGFDPSACLPLTTSKSTFSRPYRVTFAVCACAANGAPRTPATATATSFFFIESLLYAEKIGKEPAFCACHRNLLNSCEKLRPLCQTGESIGKATPRTSSPLCRAVVPKQQATARARRAFRSTRWAKMMIGKGKCVNVHYLSGAGVATP